MLYGPFRQHPWREDIFHRPDKIQKNLQALGFGFDVAMVSQAPSGNDQLPEVRIARHPVYDQTTGVLKEAHFLPGTIQDYPTVIDHWVHNFQDEVRQPDGTYQRMAYGIGLPAERLWNHKSIQTFGNRKDLMDALIASHGAGIATYGVLDYQQFADIHGGGRKLIYKPQGGSYGVGVRVFKDVFELQAALRAEKVAHNGLIQPYLQTMNPIQGVMPATSEDAELLRKFNTTADRPREIRMHVITTTDHRGQLHTEAYPMMKVSEPNQQFLKYQMGIGIDPSCLAKGTFIHDKSVVLAQALCRAAGEPGKPVPQYYGVFDWLIDGDVHDPSNVWIGDGNCRGPGIPECAAAARDALERALVFSGNKVLQGV